MVQYLSPRYTKKLQVHYKQQLIWNCLFDQCPEVYCITVPTHLLIYWGQVINTFKCLAFTREIKTHIQYEMTLWKEYNSKLS